MINIEKLAKGSVVIDNNGIKNLYKELTDILITISGPNIIVTYGDDNVFSIRYLDIGLINGETKPNTIQLTQILLSEEVFNFGGGDGGSVSQSDTYYGVDALTDEELNILYPDAGQRFLLGAPNVGSGMFYLNFIEPDNNNMWYTWSASRVE